MTMSTTTTAPTRGILADLVFLDGIVRQIGPERIQSVNTDGAVMPVDWSDGHAIAAELGLTDATDFPKSVAAFTTYRGHIDGHEVTVFATLRHRGRNVHVQAVTA